MKQRKNYGNAFKSTCCVLRSVLHTQRLSFSLILIKIKICYHIIEPFIIANVKNPTKLSKDDLCINLFFH